MQKVVFEKTKKKKNEMKIFQSAPTSSIPTDGVTAGDGAADVSAGERLIKGGGFSTVCSRGLVEMSKTSEREMN